jgi:hypothetical protein
MPTIIVETTTSMSDSPRDFGFRVSDFGLPANAASIRNPQSAIRNRFKHADFIA